MKKRTVAMSSAKPPATISKTSETSRLAHYLEQQGELMPWGPIQHYHYHDGRGHLYLAEPDGRFVEVTGSGGLCEGRATLSVGMHL